MRKKGFTIAELLAVIIILASIFALTAFVIENIISSSREKAYQLAVEQIVFGAEQYLLDYKNEIEGLDEIGVGYITIEDMVEKGIFTRELINPQTKEPFPAESVVVVTRISHNNYDFTFYLDENETPFFCGTVLIDERDDEEYSTVQMGNQCWITEDLRYDNGCSGNSWTDSAPFDACETPGVEYDGLLYQWGAAMLGNSEEGEQGICPSGWYIPTDYDYKELEMYLGMRQGEADKGQSYRGTNQGDKLKDLEADWCKDAQDCGISGFNALPAGYFNPDAELTNSGVTSFFWTSTFDVSNPRYRFLVSNNSGVYRHVASPANGFWVRCLKDRSIIRISGNNPVIIGVGTTYSDAGAIAWSSVDGDITVDMNVTNTVNYNVAGTYNATYSVTDSLGNSATATRIVKVVTPFAACGDYLKDERDEKFYATVEIGDQCWMAEDLLHDDGCSENSWTDSAPFDACLDNEDIDFPTIHYQWEALMAGDTGEESQGICPSGWYIPSDDDWKELEMHLGMSQEEADEQSWRATNEGDKLKDIDAEWCYEETDCGISGFNALPTGMRTSAGSLALDGSVARWTSSTLDGANVWRRDLDILFPTIFRYNEGFAVGHSIRCLLAE